MRHTARKNRSFTGTSDSCRRCCGKGVEILLEQDLGREVIDRLVASPADRSSPTAGFIGREEFSLEGDFYVQVAKLVGKLETAAGRRAG
jgi:hypothetical protein